MVIADMAMSLDGFVADADDGMLRLDEPGAAKPRDAVGAVICGRRSFDITGGWCGHHPLEAPVFVVTHSVPYGWPREGAPVTFMVNGKQYLFVGMMDRGGELQGTNRRIQNVYTLFGL